ncbi:hypothetical protein QZH41_019526 [Actinostola sp. cb2023]|nr:hypothetical protein QZH41_019526 [Actinostola sp. cb2023]
MNVFVSSVYKEHKSSVVQAQEEWTIREKLTLASSVQRSGDQNWVSVSRAIKPINETGCCGKNRPADFFSQKNCAIHYSQMLEKVNTPKRKRTNETGAGGNFSFSETPGEQIVRKLTFERIDELKKSMKNDQLTYRKLKMRIEDIRNGKLDAQLPAVWEEIQAKRRMEELKQMQASGTLPSPGGDNSAAPLPGPPGVTISVTSNTISGKICSFTRTCNIQQQKKCLLKLMIFFSLQMLAQLLKQESLDYRFQKYQQQLQQRHSQGSQHSQPSGIPGDIGIVAGDPSRGTIIDTPRLSLDAEPLKTEPMDIDPGTAVQTVSVDMPPSSPFEVITPKAEPGVTSPVNQYTTARRASIGNTTAQAESLKTLLSQPAKEQTNTPHQELTNKGSDTQPSVTVIPQDSHSSSPAAPVSQPMTKSQVNEGKSFLGGADDVGGGAVTSIALNFKEMMTESVVKIIEPVPCQSERKSIEEIIIIKEEPDVTSGGTDQGLTPETKIEIVDTPQPSPRVTGRTRAPKPGRPGRPRGRRSQRRSKSVTSTDNETEVEEEKEEDNKSESMEAESEKASEKDEDDDDMESTVSEKKDDSDDDEEEQESIDDVYSESGDRSKEESYLDRASTIGSESVPASPASHISQGDMDSDSLQAKKTWKKSIMLVWRAAANHKYANVFLHAVTNDEAPGYHNIVFRPMDLTTIKKNIENGSIRTTSEFQRDMMLMFQNALMYNSADHDVYRMAEEMRDDVMDQIQVTARQTLPELEMENQIETLSDGHVWILVLAFVHPCLCDSALVIEIGSVIVDAYA